MRYGRPDPNDQISQARLRRSQQRQAITGLAAQLADAIRTDNQEALDRTQAALHRFGGELPRD